MGVVGAVGHPGAQEDIAHHSLRHRLGTPAWFKAPSWTQHLLWLNSAVDIIQFYNLF